MAEIIQNKKDFKVIKTTLLELRQAFGGFGICDFCGQEAMQGYYIAVLNQWYCEKDYQRFINEAYNYPDDRRIENINFQQAKILLNL